MKTNHIFAAAIGGLLTAGVLSADNHSATAAFSDPTQPGRFQARLLQGEISIRGSDVDEVTVSTDAFRRAEEKTRADGMRVISAGASFSLHEENNVITLDASAAGGWGDDAEFNITVPHDAHIDIEVSMGGEVTVADISGDVSIKNLNGEIELLDLSGGALIESMNGEIEASFLTVHEHRPLSFSSMNGEIELHLPADAQANVRFRSQNGTILTNFGEDVLVTTTTSGRAFAPEAHEEIAEFAAEMAEGAVEMAMEIAEEVREAMRAARLEMQEQREMEEELRETQIEIREAEEEMAIVKREMKVEAKAPRAPRPPRPPSIPSMAGGKVISGTLNGGGVDLQIATMNGDILVRKRED
jgi:hypothetical protein